MRIRRLRLVNFGRFSDSELALDPGLNLIVGPNESGKSTVVEALGTALYADVTSRARVLTKNARWGSGGMRLELDFENGDGAFRLIKDFAQGQVQLEDVGTGEIMTGRSEVERAVTRMVGFASRDAFESVASVQQGELAALEGKEGRKHRAALVPVIERKMTSSGGHVDAAGVLSKINGSIDAIGVGMESPAKRPGPLKTLTDQRAHLLSNVKAAKAAWDDVLQLKGDLAQERAMLEEKTEKLSRISRVLEAEGSRLEVNEELAAVAEGLEASEAKIAHIRKLRDDMRGRQEKADRISRKDEERVKSAKFELDGSERRVKKLEDEAPRGAARSGAGPAVLATLVGLIALSLLLVPALSGRTVDFRTMWILLAIGTTAAIASFFLFRRAARLLTYQRDLQRERGERDQARSALEEALKDLGVRDVDEFERTVREDRLSWQEAENLRSKLSEACDGNDADRFEETLRTRAASLATRKSELEKRLAAGGGRERELSARELAEMRAERERLTEEVSLLEKNVLIGEDRLVRDDAGESLPDLMGRLETVESELAALKRRLLVLGHAREGLESALFTTKEKAANVIEPAVSEVLSKVTGGRYSSVSIKQDLSLHVTNPEPRNGAPDELSSEDLSAGAVDQVYLATRFALLEFLSPDEGAPFVLDDVFVTFDPERRDGAFRVLRELAARRQVIFFSCEEHGADYAHKVLHL